MRKTSNGAVREERADAEGDASTRRQSPDEHGTSIEDTARASLELRVRIDRYMDGMYERLETRAPRNRARELLYLARLGLYVEQSNFRWPAQSFWINRTGDRTWED